MPISAFWIVVIVGIVVLATVLAVMTRSGMSRGQTPPGPPTNLHADTHDEPVEDTAKSLDGPRHAHSSEGVAKAARDEERLLGH